MSSKDVTKRIEKLRAEYKTASKKRKLEIKKEAEDLKSIRIVCYLNGCINAAIADLTAFCCQEHKDKYNNNQLPKEAKKRLTIPEIQERLLKMGKNKRRN